MTVDPRERFIRTLQRMVTPERMQKISRALLAKAMFGVPGEREKAQSMFLNWTLGRQRDHKLLPRCGPEVLKSAASLRAAITLGQIQPEFAEDILFVLGQHEPSNAGAFTPKTDPGFGPIFIESPDATNPDPSRN